MEDELKCPICKHFYNHPVILPCYHSMCLNCATSLQLKDDEEGLSCSSSSESDPDKVSLISETDSGVICSRPNSTYLLSSNICNIFFPTISYSIYHLTCYCGKIVLLDDNGAKSLPRNGILENIVNKYRDTLAYCQLCPNEPLEATLMCEQCEILYCNSCKDAYHPDRGPLAKHSLIDPKNGIVNRRNDCSLKCSEHNQIYTNYCFNCKIPFCSNCTINNDKHINHNVHSLSIMCKAQKNIEKY